MLCIIIATAGLHELLKKIEETEGGLRVSDVCHVIQYNGKNEKLNRYTPQITYYGLSDGILECAKCYPRYEESSTFMSCWMRTSNAILAKIKSQNDELTFDDIVELVWEPTLGEFTELCRNLATGTITFGKVDKHFAIYKGKYDKLLPEFRQMCMAAGIARNWVTQRFKQIQQYHQLHQYTTGAKLMLDLKNKFQLTGNFGKLDLLLSTVSYYSIIQAS